MTDPRDAEDTAFPDPGAFDDEARGRVSARSVAIWGARATGGVVGVAVAVAVGAAALLVVPPTWSVTPPLVVVDPEPAPQTLVCPGPLLRLADATGQHASEARPVGEPPVVRFAAESGELETSAVAQSDAGTGGTDAAPRLATVTPVDGETPIVAGLQSGAVAASDANLVGYATASCEHPSRRAWILGGSTQLGRTSILTLVNPTSVEAVVDLELYGETGRIDAVGLDGIVVPPGTQRVIPINGLALEQRAPVVGIESTGGSVAAYVQESIIRTLTPGGAELLGQQDPASTLVIPGVLVFGEDRLTGLNATPVDEDDTRPTLRLFAPGAPTATATVAIVPAGATLADALAHPRVVVGESPTDAHQPVPAAPVAESFEVTLTEGAVTELPITGVAAGEYTIVVSAAAPIVGGVRASVTNPAATDFAWYSPAPALGERAVVATPDAPTVLLAITNPTAAERTVTATTDDVEASLVISAGGTLLTPLEPATDYALGGMEGLHAAVRSSGTGLVAQSPLLAAASLAQPVRVHP